MVVNLSTSSSDMKRSIKYLIVFVVLFFAIDFSIGLIMNRVFPGITYGTYGKVNKSLETDQEVLIFGSSRAEHHYNPEIITRETGLSCYNTGLGGYGLFYNYALLNEIVNEYKPKVVILDLSPNVIVDPKTYVKLNTFTPYYSNYSSFNEIIQLDPEFSKFKTFFKTYVYNSTLYDYVRGKITGEISENGYKGLQPEMNTTAYNRMILSDHEIFDTTKKEYLAKFIDTALEHNVRLICMVSPTYEKYDINNRIIHEMEELIVSKGVEFYDFSDYEKLYQKPQFFKDQLHVNTKGVEIFNREVSNLIVN